MSNSESFKSIVLNHGKLHIETPLGIVNIRVGLTDMYGRSVDSIELIPDMEQGTRRVKRTGVGNTRFIELKTKGIRHSDNSRAQNLTNDGR